MSTPTPVDIVSNPTPVDYMSATAEILAAIAWPAAIVTLVTVFRRPILDALKGIVEFRWGSASVKIDRTLDEVAASVAESSGNIPPRATFATPSLTEMLEGYEPRSAVIKGYVALEDWAVTNFPAHGIPVRRNHRNRPLMEMVREGVNQGKLPPTAISQVQGLQTLRNLAVHAVVDPTPEQASEFLTLADAVLYLMQSSLESQSSRPPGVPPG